MEISTTLTPSASNPDAVANGSPAARRLTRYEIRALIRTLSGWQITKMQQSQYKGHWGAASFDHLCRRFLEEIQEWGEAYEAKLHPDEFWKETADCCNILAMIASNYEAAYGEQTTPVQEGAEPVGPTAS